MNQEEKLSFLNNSLVVNEFVGSKNYFLLLVGMLLFIESNILANLQIL